MLLPQVRGSAAIWASTTDCNSSAIAYIGGNDGALYAFNVLTGAQVFAFQTGGDIASTPAVAPAVSINGTKIPVVYFGSYDKTVYAINGVTGAQVLMTPVRLALATLARPEAGCSDRTCAPFHDRYSNHRYSTPRSGPSKRETTSRLQRRLFKTIHCSPCILAQPICTSTPWMAAAARCNGKVLDGKKLETHQKL